MIHPIYMAALRRPDLLVKHASNYGALLRESAKDLVRGTAVKAAAWVVVGMCCFLGLAFSGFAVMLGLHQHRFHWVLVAVPAAAFLVAGIAAMFAMRSVVAKEIHDVAVELEADRDSMKRVKEAKKDD